MYKCDNSAGAPGGDGQVDGGEDHHAGHVHCDHQLVRVFHADVGRRLV